MPLNTQAKIDLINTDPKLATSIMTGPLPQDDFIGGVSLGADYTKYLQMRRDPHVRSVMQRRRQSLLARRVIIDYPKGFKARDRADFDRLPERLKYESICSSLLNTGQLIGFSVLQLDWVKTDDDFILPNWRFVPQDRFLFAWHQPERRDIPTCSGESLDPNTEIVLVQGYELRLLTRNNPIQGERCPRDRFLIYTFDADESPWGLGLGYSIYPWYVVKRECMKAWLLHSDRMGSPPTLGITPEGIDEEDPEVTRLLRKFDSFLKSISPSAWARLPVGFEAKVMDLVGAAGPDVHERLIKTANDEISKVVLGEVPYSDKQTGSYAANISQVEDREASLIDADVNLLDEPCQERLWLPVCQLNYPDAPIPTVRRETRADDREQEAKKLDQERKKARIDQDKTMQELGYRVNPEMVAEIYGPEYVDASSINQSEDQDAPQALAAILGPRTDTLLTFLQQMGQTGYPRANAIAVVMNIFGIPKNIAESLVPEAQPTEPKATDGTNPEPATPAPATLEEALAGLQFIELEPPYELSTGIDFSDRRVEWATDIAAIKQRLRMAESDMAAMLEFEDSLQQAVDGTFNFAAKQPATPGKKKNCTPGKSHFCQRPGGAGTCLPMSKKCRYQPTGTAQQAANYVGQQANSQASTATTPKTTKPKAATKSKAATNPDPDPDNPVRTNQPELDKSRADLEQRFGKQQVEAAEANVKRIMDDPDTNVYVRVGSADTLEKILGDRFKTSAELGVDTHTIPHLKDKYQKARNRVEAKTLGYDEKNTKADERPIYGYIGGKDLDGAAHADVSQAYGSIAVKLKSEVKDRTTFTAADSFKSGIASQIKSDGTPPPPNAASLVASTRHGYDVDQLPAHYPSYYNDKTVHGSQLSKAAKAKSVDDLVDVGATTGNRYIEAQVHGKVAPSDIAEIHFSPKGISDKPNAAIAQFAKDNQVDIYVNGKKLSTQELDRLITPPADPRSQRLQDLSKALDSDDFDSVMSNALQVHDAATKVRMNPGENDNYLKALYQDAGYDGLPKVGTSADLDTIYQNGGLFMVRGVTPDDYDDKLKYLRDFQTGDYFTGNGIYGNGTYVGHSGYVNSKGQFIHKNDPTAAKDAKRAVDNVAKHGYMSSSTTNFRMAADPDFNVVTQSQLIKERDDLDAKIKQWATAQRQKLLAGARVITKAEATKFDNKVKAQRSQYDPALLSVQNGKATTKNGGITKVVMQDWEIPSTTDGQPPLKIKVERQTSVTITGGSLSTFIFRDAQTGAVIKSVDQASGKPNKTTVKKIYEASIEYEVAKQNGYDRPPKAGDINDPVVAKRVQQFDDDLTKTKTVLGLDHNGYSNLAVIKGYDAVALNRSYEPETFMNLLNRSKVTVQDKPLDWKRAKKKGAA